MNEFNSAEKRPKKIIKRQNKLGRGEKGMDVAGSDSKNIIQTSDALLKKQKNKLKKGKLTNKNVSKLLMEPVKPIDAPEKNDPDDIQFLIKTNIIKVLGAVQRAKNKEHNRKKKPGKTIPAKVITRKSESADENKSGPNPKLPGLPIAKSDQVPPSKKATGQGKKSTNLKRAKNANPPKPKKNPEIPSGSQERAPKESNKQVAKTTKLSDLNPIGMQKLKNMFNIFKPLPGSSSSKLKSNDKTLDIVFSREMHDAELKSKKASTNRKEKAKATLKEELKKGKKQKAPAKQEPLPVMQAAKQIGDLAATIKGKNRPNSAIPTNQANLQKVLSNPEPPSKSDLMNEKPKKKKALSQKLLYTVTA